MAVALLGALVAAPHLRAQGSKPTDYDVKAVYLYNFGRFVEWPVSVASKSDSFNVCVFGQDPFGPTLDSTLAGETIGGKSVAAKRISSPQEAVRCQILFMSATEDSRLNKIMEALDKGAVLTVSDMPQFSQRGGMIQFVLEGKKVRFEVNLTAVQRAGLTLSSELLKVATAVRRDP
ncbi:MAG: YfiR family protein [Terriglobales bacterium]